MSSSDCHACKAIDPECSFCGDLLGDGHLGVQLANDSGECKDEELHELNSSRERSRQTLKRVRTQLDAGQIDHAEAFDRLARSVELGAPASRQLRRSA